VPAFIGRNADAPVTPVAFMPEAAGPPSIALTLGTPLRACVLPVPPMGAKEGIGGAFPMFGVPSMLPTPGFLRGATIGEPPKGTEVTYEVIAALHRRSITTARSSNDSSLQLSSSSTTSADLVT
jgi:hypothetical protein